jgi:hypothetical protein
LLLLGGPEVGTVPAVAPEARSEAIRP